MKVCFIFIARIDRMSAGYTLPFVLTKMSGIAYVTIIYFFVGIVIARIFDAVYGKFDEDD